MGAAKDSLGASKVRKKISISQRQSRHSKDSDFWGEGRCGKELSEQQLVLRAGGRFSSGAQVGGNGAQLYAQHPPPPPCHISKLTLIIFTTALGRFKARRTSLSKSMMSLLEMGQWHLKSTVLSWSLAT